MSKFDYRRLTPCKYEDLKEFVEYKPVDYVTDKTYPDGSRQVLVKSGVAPIDEENRQKLKRNKDLSLLCRYKPGKDSILKNVASEANLFNYTEVNKKYDETADKLSVKWFNEKNIAISMARSKKEMLDIVRCNNFDWFLSLTFNKSKVKDRYDDKETRKKCLRWLNNLRLAYPKAIYLAVAEYHKKGALHFHIMLGNITADELKLTDSGKCVRKGYCKGDIIYNVNRWRKGFSTATKIRSVRRCKWYIMKYLRKQKYDARFLGKKRFVVSQNVVRPVVVKYTCDADYNAVEVYSNTLEIVYQDERKGYTVLESEIIEKPCDD